MNYDLAISDFDGTLLRNDDSISDFTAAAVKRFTQSGGIFGVSTGRAYSSIKQRLGEVGLSGNFPVLCCQGALSVDFKSGEIISQIGMDVSSAEEFLQRAEERNLICQFYTAHRVYVPELNEINGYYFNKNRITPQQVGKLSKFVKKCRDPILKTVCFITPEIREETFKAFCGIKNAKTFTSNPRLFEAVSDKAGKGNGLKAVCKRLNVPLSRSAAIGDELNDIDMIKAAGLGVAMGNAVKEVKAAADYVTADNDNDGVAAVLEKIINEEI